MRTVLAALIRIVLRRHTALDRGDDEIRSGDNGDYAKDEQKRLQDIGCAHGNTDLS